MRYISIDIETTGLDPEKHQILEIGAVDSEERSKFHCYVWHEEYRGEAYALGMNARIFEQLKKLDSEKMRLLGEGVAPDGVKVYSEQVVGRMFELFLYDMRIEDRAVVAGKNVGMFDLRFLERLPDWPKCHHRVIDPAMLF